MKPNDPERLIALEEKQILLNASLMQMEKDWKALRLASRENVLEMVTQENVSVARASQLSGHHRATITTWLQIWNAEHKKDSPRK